MADENKKLGKDEDSGLRQANNLTELEPRDELDPTVDPDPLTDHRSVAQTPTADEDLLVLPKDERGNRTGDYDVTTGAAHPTADSEADKGVGKE
jgi:hypothetical protein